MCADSNLSPNGGRLNTNVLASSKILNVIFDLPTLNCSKLKSSEISTTVENFEDVRKALEDGGIPMETAEVTRIPANTVAVDENKGKALLKLMDILEDHDDIQKSYSNFDIPDDVMNAILEGN